MAQESPFSSLETVLILDFIHLSLANQTGQMTTLFQTTGQQGFLKARVFNKNIFIGSATQFGSGLGAILVRSLACEPCNLSVLYISTAVVPVGISGSNSPVQPPVLEAPSESPANAPEYSGESPPKGKRSPPKVAGPPATSAGGDSSDLGIGVYVVLTIIIYLQWV
ncbi:hypothetical protein L1987_51888 [Smallanthus sonchifolius]|uniref:Uncharacterized protein n=1 Tax=Smallanthus sonchifolius TaxID=185202 RepID=A0ACB9ESP9_9ASTR|nr:hypothetical protein L1987_51888 [Smallanthus sonchifolius]